LDKTGLELKDTCQPWAQLGGGHGDASPHFFGQWEYNMPCSPHFSL